MLRCLAARQIACLGSASGTDSAFVETDPAAPALEALHEHFFS